MMVNAMSPFVYLGSGEPKSSVRMLSLGGDINTVWNNKPSFSFRECTGTWWESVRCQ